MAAGAAICSRWSSGRLLTDSTSLGPPFTGRCKGEVMRLAIRLPILISLALVLFAPQAGAAGVSIPTPSVSVDRDDLRLIGVVGEVLTADFEIRNHKGCGVRLTQTRASESGIVVTCPVWRLSAAGSTTCTVTATSLRSGVIVDGLLLTARVVAVAQNPRKSGEYRTHRCLRSAALRSARSLASLCR